MSVFEKCPNCGKTLPPFSKSCPKCGCPRGGFVAPEPKYHVSDRIMLGRWGDEPITWRVLKVEKDRALVLTERIIDFVPFDTSENLRREWEWCSLRQWLNSVFYETAFSKAEMGEILLTSNYNDGFSGASGYPLQHIYMGKTSDYVFCLADNEINLDYGFELSERPLDCGIRVQDRDLIAQPTRYAASRSPWAIRPEYAPWNRPADYRGFVEPYSAGAKWWLRNSFNWYACIVDENGFLYDHYNYAHAAVDSVDVGVRPAMCLRV